jgi:hypothetical protein
MFFQNAFGSGGMGGSPSAFTSPGMNPQMLAMLAAMQQGGGPQMGGPQLPPPPQGGGTNAPPQQPMTGPKQPDQAASGNILQQLSALGGIKPGGAQAGGNNLAAMLGGTGGANGVGGLFGQLGQWLGLNPGVTGGGFGDFSPRIGGAYF